MEDKGELVLASVISDKNTVQAIPHDPQTINTSTPADVDITAVDPNPDLESKVASGIDDLPATDTVLFIPTTVDVSDLGVVKFSNDTRLASNRGYSMLVDSLDDPRFAMKSNIRQRDAFTTIVDMLGHPQPTLHHLIREGNSGFITFENGKRILIL